MRTVGIRSVVAAARARETGCRVLPGRRAVALRRRRAMLGGIMSGHRLFVALRPARPVRTALIAAMHGIAAARWQSDEQLHLTLRFIGEVDRHRDRKSTRLNSSH